MGNGASQRFQEIRELGRGGFGRVVHARDTHQGHREVAVKYLLAAWEPSHVERFKREVQETAKLWSDRIVQVLHQDLAATPPFYVMPFFSSGSLRTILLQHKRERVVYTQDAALVILGSLLEGLKIAHDAGVCHRDLKPDNLLIDGNGELILSDFGLGKFVHQYSLVLTAKGPMGTGAYCSPEQWTTGEGSESSDLFSVGIVLFEMLLGVVPQRDQFHRVRDLPSRHDNRIPKTVDEFFTRFVRTTPADRFQSCSEALAALDKLLMETYKKKRPFRIDIRNFVGTFVETIKSIFAKKD